MPYMPTGRKPEYRDLEFLVANNPHADACWAVYDNSDMTWEEFLLSLALTLADAHHALALLELGRMEREPPAPFIVATKGE